MRWNSKKGQAGLSLVEIMVTSGALLLLMGLLTGIYVSSSRVWQKVDRETTLLREIQVAMRALEREISIGHPTGLTRGTNAVAYLSCSDSDNRIAFNDRGQPLWQRFVFVYADPNGVLRQGEYSRATPSRDALSFFQETSQSLDTYLGTTVASDHRRLTHAGRVIELSLEPTGNYGSLYTLRITAEQERVNEPLENIVLETEISVRNGF